MAIGSSTSTQSSSSGIWAQIQQQNAQRTADQAERQARSLKSMAQDAEATAAQAQENARTLKVQSSQAQGEAESARRGVATMKSLGVVQAQFAGLRQQISDVLSPTETPASGGAGLAAPVLNAYGQPTWSLVNVTA